MMKKQLLHTVLFGLLLGSAMTAQALEIGTKISTPCPFGECQNAFELSYFGEVDVPTDTFFQNVEVGGLSGIDYDPQTGHYIAISDDRSEKGPTRFYTLSLDFTKEGLKAVHILKSTTLLTKQGKPFGKMMADSESIRVFNGKVLWTSEGWGSHEIPPFVRIADMNGHFIREFTLPKGFAPTKNHKSGIRDNLAFEGSTVLPDGDILIGMETALYQDGPISSLLHGSLARIIRYDAQTGKPKAEYVYPVSPIPQAAATSKGGNDNGVSEIYALDNTHYLALERGWAEGVGNYAKLFLVDISGATDVSNIASLIHSKQRIVPVRKTLVLNIRALGIKPDNLEGVTIGKTKAGQEVLIIEADNNFNKHETNQFLAFKVLKRPGLNRPVN